MTLAFLYIQLILTAIVTATACCLPGTFLILRGTSLISDAISHAIFLGIVISFLIFKKMYTPYLFFGATITALCTIWCIEQIINTKKIYSDAIIGITFPFLFSIAVILINTYAYNIHLDIDAVLLGELAFSPFYQIYYNNTPIGSYALWTMSTILLCNLLVIFISYPNLLITSFDPDFASIINAYPKRTYWILMTITCITILGAFEAVGAILVVAFIITPAAISFLICKKLSDMLITSALISILGTLIGCLLAHITETSIGGSIATSYSAIFAIVCIFQSIIR